MLRDLSRALRKCAPPPAAFRPAPHTPISPDHEPEPGFADPSPTPRDQPPQALA